jgi:exopolyphosphatase/guanosine-5'-triphosphate,3'-diphosphate pyrophosphatase
LVIDIGGGSTEFIVGEGHVPDSLESASVGCVGITETFFEGGEITRKRFKEAQTAAALELRPLRRTFRVGGWDAVWTQSDVPPCCFESRCCSTDADERATP